MFRNVLGLSRIWLGKLPQVSLEIFFLMSKDFNLGKICLQSLLKIYFYHLNKQK